MKKKRKNSGGSFGGGKRKPKSNSITLDLNGYEFNPSVDTQALSHTAPNFRAVLEELNWHSEWAIIWNGLLERYRAEPARPHSVHEAFIRGDRGYIPMIVAATSPEHKEQVRGLLISVALNPDAAKEDQLEALYELGASACTQFLTRAAGQSFVIWEKPL